MKRRFTIGGAAALALLAAPAGGAQPADLLAPGPAPAASPAPCEGAAAERAALEAERVELDRAVADVAMGRRKKRRMSGGEVAAGVAGTAASVLLPFGVGALLGMGAKAAARSGRKKGPAAAAPDVPAMVDRLRLVEARLAQLAACP